MTLTPLQIKSVRNAIDSALSVFKMPEPLTVSEWGDENFYLSGESSSNPGRWETLPFQVAILNSMGDDRIRVVNLVKSARVGYSQMVKCAIAYGIEHKARNVIMYQPNNAQADSFSKTQISPMVRDCKSLRRLAPWINKKNDKDSTKNAKRFSNGRQLFILGGEAAANYRERSVDSVFYDELAAFPEDVEGEGSPTSLGDKRTEVSVFRKSIRGSTPKLKGSCQIERAAEESTARFSFELPCPHCDEYQRLEWGGRDFDYGFKWQEGNPHSVGYLCRHCGALISQEESFTSQERGVWFCRESGYSTDDGVTYYHDGKETEPPEKLTWLIWTAYSPFKTWKGIVEDFLIAKKDTGKLKTWVNTTLGEPWEAPGESIDPKSLMARKEDFTNGGDFQIPGRVLILTAGADVQQDRIELVLIGWGKGEEAWAVDYRIFRGDPEKEQIWRDVDEYLATRYRHESGSVIGVTTAMIDCGYLPSQVHRFTRPRERRGIFAVKGSNQAHDPIVKARPSQNNNFRAQTWYVGGVESKDTVFNMINTADPGPRYFHFSDSPAFDEEFFLQLAAERRTTKIVNGRRVPHYKKTRERNEALDVVCYALAGLHVANPNFERLERALNPQEAPPKPPEPSPAQRMSAKRRAALRSRPNQKTYR